MDPAPFNENPLQRLSAGGAIGRAFSLLFERMDVFLPIGAVCWIPIVAMAVSLLAFVGSSVSNASQFMNQQQGNGAGAYYDSSSSANDSFLKQQQSQTGAFLGQFIIEVILFDIIVIMARGAVVHAVATMYAQLRPTFAQSMKQGCSRWCDLFLAGFLLGIAVLICHLIVSVIIFAIMSVSDSLAILALVVQIVYFCFLAYVMVSFMILVPVIIVERKSASDCLWRCVELADGNRCFLFCSVFCIAVINWIIQLILAQILFATHKDGHDIVTTAPILYAAVTTLTTFFYLPLISIMETVVYFNIRVEREGMNLGILEGEMGIAASGTVQHATFAEDDQGAPSKFSDAPVTAKAELV